MDIADLKEQQLVSIPHVIIDLFDRFVVFKPPGWEAENSYPSSGTNLLLSFVQAFLSPLKHSICIDAEHNCGFIHRLDVPCSGLILVAKTYEAYYDLVVQLNAGKIIRDYIVLCHEWVP